MINFKLDNFKVTAINEDIKTNIAEPSSGPEFWLLDERQVAGTHAPAFPSGIVTRQINATLNTVTWGSLNSTTNEITLQPGKYIIEASAPAFMVLRHKIQLYDEGTSFVMGLGSSAYAKNGSSTEEISRSFMQVTLDIPVTSTYTLRHYGQQTSTFAGQGLATGSAGGNTEIYAQMKITRIGDF